MRTPTTLLRTVLPSLLLLPSPAAAVFRDEVGHIDFHHLLLGLPQRDTTFFHRPRRDDRASLLYTLTDAAVVGAVNPGTGEVLWRQPLTAFYNSIGHGNDTGGLLRAGEGEGWVVSAYGDAVHAWDAISGRNRFHAAFGGGGGRVVDLEVMEMTESGEARKDVLALFEEEKAGSTVLRRLSAEDGSVVWEFREVTRDVPLQVSTNLEKVFVVSLKGAPGAYSLKVGVLDPVTGRKLDEVVLGSKGDDVRSKEDVVLVGANSAAPIVGWTDAARKTLWVNVLGSKTRHPFSLADDTVSVEIHAPHLVQSQPHFLVHTRTVTGHRGQVFHIDLKTNTVAQAYSLPHLAGPGAFSTSSDGANVYFTRITEDEVILLSSQSHGVLARWPLKARGDAALHGVSEVIRKPGAEDSYAVRAAAVTDADDWVLIRNGETAWTRPEGMSGAVAATFAEIPEDEDLARSLEQEAHSNPWQAYLHRVRRHLNDLRYLPAWLESIPARFMSSVLGTDVAPPAAGGKLVRDSFGFHKLAILATRRGMVYALDVGNKGRILWRKRAFKIPRGRQWDVKGIQIHDGTGQATILGAHNDFVVLRVDTGEIMEAKGPSPEATTQATALVNTDSGSQLIRIGRGGRIGELSADKAPRQTIVTRGPDGELRGVVFVANGTTAYETTSWTFSPPEGYRIVHIATRPAHEAVASIGRVLGDRTVLYKYLNPNTVVAAAVDDTTHTLAVYLLDTVSGQILASTRHPGVDPSKPIECAMSENWFACTFFGRYPLRDDPAQSLQGYQIVVSDLYESDVPNDRGPLGDPASSKSADYSAVGPVDDPTGRVPLPAIVSQAYILSAPITALQTTQTRQGIASRQLLAYLPEARGVAAIPRVVLDPRRPVGRDPTPAEVEEGLIRYHPALEIDPRSVVSHEWDVLGVERIETVPAVVESIKLQSHIYAAKFRARSEAKTRPSPRSSVRAGATTYPRHKVLGRAAKVKCQASSQLGICKRCLESKRECIFKTGPRTRRPRQSRRNLNTTTATTPASGSPSSSNVQPPPPRHHHPPPPGPSKTFTIDIPMAPEDDYDPDLAGPLEALRLTHEHALNLLAPHVSEGEEGEEEDWAGAEVGLRDEDMEVEEDGGEWPDQASTSGAGSSALSHASSLPVGASALSTPPSGVGIMAATSTRPARTLASMRLQPQFNLDSARDLLRRFREVMLGHFHCVVVGEEDTVPSMARERPFVLLAVLAAASGNATLQGHSLYDEEFRKVLGLKFVAGGERTRELLQGLVIYISWYPFHLRPKNRQAMQYIRMVVDIVTDLELDQDPGTDSMDVPPTPERLDEIRLYLASYYLTSDFASTWSRTPALTYTDYTSQCCELLQRHSSLHGDHVLAWQVRFQRLAEETNELRRTQRGLSQSEYQVELIIRGMETQLAEWEACLDPLIAAAVPIRIAVRFARVFLSGAPLLKFPSAKLKPRPTPDAPSSMLRADTQRLVSAIPALHDLYECFLSLGPADFNAFTGAEWSSLILAIILGFRMSFPLVACPEWDDVAARSEVRFGEYIERFCRMGGAGSEHAADIRARLASAAAGVDGTAKQQPPRSMDVLSASKVVLEMVKAKFWRRVARLEGGSASQAQRRQQVQQEQQQQHQPHQNSQQQHQHQIHLPPSTTTAAAYPPPTVSIVNPWSTAPPPPPSAVPGHNDGSITGCPMMDGSLESFYPYWDETFTNHHSAGAGKGAPGPGFGVMFGSGGGSSSGYEDQMSTSASAWFGLPPQ
ncbi:hypothetical protein VTJ49DRAFT_2387 [Mycothermus thermophilus]|uniref:ER membrane protein complex subunit 1 n=1 Tax=Humicola insolens TaxID=85995 RepID=A0ABR3VMZ8_HUMIN